VWINVLSRIVGHRPRCNSLAWLADASHVATSPIVVQDDAATELPPAFAARVELACKTEVPAAEIPVPWHNHDAQCLRANLHIAERFRAECSDLEFTGWLHPEVYGLSRESRYSIALGEEPERLIGVPLSELSAIPPPQKFVDVWRDDVRHWFRALADPSDEQSGATLCGLKKFTTINNGEDN
jgi:hypothetical protein